VEGLVEAMGWAKGERITGLHNIVSWHEHITHACTQQWPALPGRQPRRLCQPYDAAGAQRLWARRQQRVQMHRAWTGPTEQQQQQQQQRRRQQRQQLAAATDIGQWTGAPTHAASLNAGRVRRVRMALESAASTSVVCVQSMQASVTDMPYCIFDT
jgi:hypothetical protein